MGILANSDKLRVKWKDFVFPKSIQKVKITEPSVFATYSYAGRDGSQHEKVKDFRRFTLSGMFNQHSGSLAPVDYANKLRYLCNNEKGTLSIGGNGDYECFSNNVSIDIDADNYSIDMASSKLNDPLHNYLFNIDFYENIDPSDLQSSDFLVSLFGPISVKPAGDFYNTDIKYATHDQLLQALKEKQILPGIDPIRNAAWLKYDYTFRKKAYDEWLAWIATGGDQPSTTNKNTKKSFYTVQSGDNAFAIAAKFNVSFNSLWQANRGRKVRDTEKGSDGLYWKSSHLMHAGDQLVIPGNTHVVSSVTTPNNTIENPVSEDAAQASIDPFLSFDTNVQYLHE